MKHFGECSKMCAATKTMMALVVGQHADLNTELDQHAHKHLKIAECTKKQPQHVLAQL